MVEGQFVAIPSQQYAGVIAVNVFAILSVVALLSVLFRIIWLAFKKLWNPEAPEPREYVFFRSQLGNYAACLLIGNTLNSVAGLMGLPWLIERRITDGWLCRAQAIVLQLGNWSSGYFTVAIAVHTFLSLVLKKKQSIWVSLPAIVIGWVIAGVLAGVPFLLRYSDFVYGPSGLSCGIRDAFPRLQFVFHLLPIFVVSLLSAFLYSLIFLVLRGTLAIKGGIKLTLDPKERWNGNPENYHRFVARVAKSMLWYPVAYFAFLVPYSVMRLLVISGFKIAPEAIVFAYVCWFTLGIADVLLLYNTFRVLGPAINAQSSAACTRRTMDSFGPGLSWVHEKIEAHERNTSLQWKIDQYRASYGPSILGHSRKDGSQSSTQHLSPYDHQRSSSAQSYNSAHSLGRSITPVADLERMLEMPNPVVQKPPTARGPSPQLWLDTTPISLPAPPRRSPTPSPLTIQPYTTYAAPVAVSQGARTPPTPATVRSRYSQTSDGHQYWGSDPSGFNQPSLSAVGYTFPPAANNSSPRSGPRPLLLNPGIPSRLTSPSNPPTTLPSPVYYHALSSTPPSPPRPLLLPRNPSYSNANVNIS